MRRGGVVLQNVLATELLLRLLHDLEELLDGNATIARDISLVDNLVNVGLQVVILEDRE